MSARYGVCDDMGIFITHDQSLNEAAGTLASMQGADSSRGWQMIMESL